MFVTGLGTAVPPSCYTQSEVFEAIQQTREFAGLSLRSRALLRKVLLGHNGIETRHFSLDRIEDAFDLSPDSLHARFLKHAPVLAAQAGKCALDDARCQVEEIDAIVVSTCTGYVCPGLTSYVAERLGLRADIIALDLVGQGCGAAIPNWRTAEALLTAGRAARTLSVCVEICSAALYLDDDPGVLVSACLFGDGAGAAVLTLEPSPHQRQVLWQTAVSVLKPADRDLLRFELRAGMLRNVLTLQVPSLAAAAVEETLGQALGETGLSRDSILNWIVHSGGRDVLRAIQMRLNLAPHDLRWSAAVLRRYGNMSSASVLFALREALSGGAADGWWWLSSFGAGFSCHGALLKVGGSGLPPVSGSLHRRDQA